VPDLKQPTLPPRTAPGSHRPPLPALAEPRDPPPNRVTG
jgi:hypothetical protein